MCAAAGDGAAAAPVRGRQKGCPAAFPSCKYTFFFVDVRTKGGKLSLSAAAARGAGGKRLRSSVVSTALVFGNDCALFCKRLRSFLQPRVPARRREGLPDAARRPSRGVEKAFVCGGGRGRRQRPSAWGENVGAGAACRRQRTSTLRVVPSLMRRMLMPRWGWARGVPLRL